MRLTGVVMVLFKVGVSCYAAVLSDAKLKGFSSMPLALRSLNGLKDRLKHHAEGAEDIYLLHLFKAIYESIRHPYIYMSYRCIGLLNKTSRSCEVDVREALLDVSEPRDRQRDDRRSDGARGAALLQAPSLGHLPPSLTYYTYMIYIVYR